MLRVSPDQFLDVVEECPNLKSVRDSFASRVSTRPWAGSVPPRGSGWVRSLLGFAVIRSDAEKLRTHPLPRGGTDPAQGGAEWKNNLQHRLLYQAHTFWSWPGFSVPFTLVGPRWS